MIKFFLQDKLENRLNQIAKAANDMDKVELKPSAVIDTSLILKPSPIVCSYLFWLVSFKSYILFLRLADILCNMRYTGISDPGSYQGNKSSETNLKNK